jgi:hypothetical protein
LVVSSPIRVGEGEWPLGVCAAPHEALVDVALPVSECEGSGLGGRVVQEGRGGTVEDYGGQPGPESVYDPEIMDHFGRRWTEDGARRKPRALRRRASRRPLMASVGPFEARWSK